MTTFAITASTNSYIAARDINFNGKTEIVIKSNITLKEAQKQLLDMFNSDYDSDFACNWSVARRKRKHETTTFNDGTRSYEFDSRYYRIEEQTEELTEKFNL